MYKPSVAVIGTTGAVGQTLLQLIEGRCFPYNTVRLCGSERSLGHRIEFKGIELTIEKASAELFGEVDLVFIAAGSEVSHVLAPLAVERGAIVIDKSSAFRMDSNVPLVIPEVNSDDLNLHQGIVSSPNCSTTPLAMALKALKNLTSISRVVVDTYQSVSGSGTSAIHELRTQSKEVLSGTNITPREYPYQIAFNALPHIDDFHDSGYTGEELKMVTETRKILHQPDLPISATCVRIPVFVGHSEAVHVEFEHPVSVEDAKHVLSKSAGISVLDNTQTGEYPMPIDVAGNDDVFVGRIRKDNSHPNGIVMWLVSDNLRKGAALNAVQIAEEMLKRKMLPNAGRKE